MKNKLFAWLILVSALAWYRPVRAQMIKNPDNSVVNWKVWQKDQLDLLTLIAQGGGTDTPQTLSIKRDSLSISAGNTVVVPSWSDRDDTLQSDRVIYVNDRTFRLQGKNFSLSLNQPFSQIPLEGVVYDALTSRNPDSTLFSLSGLVGGLPDSPDSLKMGAMLLMYKNPFLGTGNYAVFAPYIDSDTITGFELNTIGPGYETNTSFQKGNIAVNSYISEDSLIRAYTLSNTGAISHSGIYANYSYQRQTAGGSDTISGVRTYIYDPPALQSTVTLTLPDPEQDGQYLTILMGGQLTVGNVINGITLTDLAGNTPLGFSATNAPVGPLGTFQSIAGQWRLVW